MKRAKVLLLTIEFLFLVTLMLYFSSCKDSVTGPADTSNRIAKSERDFAINKTLKAGAGEVIAVDLENSTTAVNVPIIGDTGPIGEDIIPYTYTETAEHRFEIGDSSYFMLLIVSDATGDTLLTLYPKAIQTVSIPAGDYKIHIISLITTEFLNAHPENKAGLSPDQIVFIQPNKGDLSLAGTGNYTPEDINTLITTRKCISCSFINADLHGLNLTNCDIGRSNFRQANLSSTDFSGSNITLCFFGNANMNKTNMESAHLHSSDFTGANLTEASFYNADVTDAVLQFCTLNSTYGIQADFSTADFKGSNMTNCRFLGSKFELAYLGNIDINGGSFEGTILKRCTLAGTIIKNCKFNQADFENANVNNGRWYNVDLSGANLCSVDKRHLVTSGVITDSETHCWP